MFKALIKNGLQLFISIALLAVPVVVFAENINLPEPMVGQTVVRDLNDNLISYGGTGANEVVFNPISSYLIGLNAVGFNTTGKECLTDVSTTNCYTLDPSGSTNPAQIMRSKTYLNGSSTPSEEVVALFYDNVISGDVMGFNYGNFALYGRNLAQNSASLLNGSWRTDDTYVMNPKAQATYDTARKAEYLARIKKLLGEAEDSGDSLFMSSAFPTHCSGGPSPSYHRYLQNSNIANNTIGQAFLYPEGKTWKKVNTGDLIDPFCGSKIFYDGVGTVIVDMNDAHTLRIGSNFKSLDSDKDKLGIIVLGNVLIAPGVEIHASIFATGTITISDNVKVVGSLMAKEFSVANANGVRIYYDYRLDSGWPPGFRYFNMPVADSAKP